MKFLKLILALVIVISLFSQCRYNFIVPEEVEIIDPDDPDAPQMSFADDIIPIFNTGDKCTSCHTTGKTTPDLSTNNAYASINNTRYIDSATPENSKIYKYPHPDGTTHNGGGKKKYSAQEAANILLWIQQGAKNN